MWAYFIIVPFIFLKQDDNCFWQNNNSKVIFPISKCNSIIDSLTGKMIYTDVDILPVNEGGKAILLKKIQRETGTDSTSIAGDYDGRIEVAFIINTDGSINGERIIWDRTNSLEKQLLAIVYAN